MSYEDEMNAGFDELAAQAGTQLKFGARALSGVIEDVGQDPLRVDLKMGGIRRVRVVISRAKLAALPVLPKVGQSFVCGSKQLRIEDIEGDDDPSATTFTYVCKQWVP